MDTKVKMADQSCSTSSGLRKQKIMTLKKIEINKILFQIIRLKTFLQEKS